MKAKYLIKFEIIIFGLVLTFCPYITLAQDTFSICAFDSVTGQVGSAGATCISSSATSALIISDVHPGVGVIHTQASYVSTNQQRARLLMDMGYSPQQIIDSMEVQDVANNPTIRQYGVVSLANGGQSAGFTGINCLDYKNHITGPTYSIQGNILMGQQILDSMEARFLNTSGNLACKLMAALQGAKVGGADQRCAPYGISSFSSFIRVANPQDTPGNFFLDINVNTYPFPKEPIDSLQVLFDQWGGCTASYISNPSTKKGIKMFPNPVSNMVMLESIIDIKNVLLITAENVVLKNLSYNFSKNIKIDTGSLSPGIYFLLARTDDENLISMKFIKVD